ncbi:phosphotransferase family enzyme [Cohnella lupini]|uniref:Phosphotransferase family enzyme n=1 Tax=Cohnella lupini TaxID=1294267 RepID=A0A3D9HPD8_9BACL|nr:phosphotransferase family enzyme [Cohnella lupini]
MHHSTISERTLGWVIDSVHPEATVLSVRQLKGGVSSLIHAVSLNVKGIRQDYVLRMFDNAEWVQREPDLALHEAESLRRASRTSGVGIPDIVAYDETGSLSGMPAVLMTRLEGEVVLQPGEVAPWLNGMARALVRIHESEAGEIPWTFAPYSDASSLDTSSWSQFPDKWRLAADIVTSRKPAFARRFIHRDYHPANIMWSEGKVSGIVDWVNGCVGPAGIDVGHCRVNLAQLHDVGTADEFLSAYRKYAGASFEYDPYWDLVTLLDFSDGEPEVYRGWTDLGVTGLTTELVIERLDSYLVSLLDRISGGI